jgi:ubiquinone/menaquinone biosynthesis C-methylase UbiE
LPIDLEDYREQSRRSWDEVAPRWQARRAWMLDETASVLDWLIAKVAPARGQTILDVAGGTGDLALRIAPLVGPEGRVISTDFAPEMVEAARRNGEEQGLSNVEHRVLDAERMDLPDDCVDGVVCRWGYMLMADPGAAIGETRRVLRAGGRLAFAVWSTPERNPWVSRPGMTMVARGHMPAPEPGAPGMFAMGDPARVRVLLVAAGFGEPVVEEIAFSFHYREAEAVWDSLLSLSASASRAVAELDDDERAATRAAILGSLAEFRQPDGSYAVPAMTWGVVAR